MQGSPAPNVNTYISTTDKRSSSGIIDGTGNLTNARVYLYSGTEDTTVKRPVMNALNSYYSHYITQSSNIVYETNIQSAHTQPTIDPNMNKCSVSASPYISYCDYDGAGIALQHIYQSLNPRNNGTAMGKMLEFDQSEFLSDPTSKSLATTGYVYVPNTCASNISCVVCVTKNNKNWCYTQASPNDFHFL